MTAIILLWLGFKSYKFLPNAKFANQSTAIIPAVASDFFATSTLNKDGLNNFTPNLGSEKLTVEWNKPAIPVAEAEVLKLMAQIDPSNAASIMNKTDRLCVKNNNPDFENENKPNCTLIIYEAGKIKSPESLKGQPVYLVFVPSYNPDEIGNGMLEYLAIYNASDKKFVAINYTESVSPPTSRWFAGSLTAKFPELAAPKQLSVPKSLSNDVRLVYRGAERSGGIFDMDSPQDNRGGVYNVREHQFSTAFQNSQSVFFDPVFGPVYLDERSFGLILPDGSVHRYELLPNFIKSKDEADKQMYPTSGEVDIEWKNKTLGAGTYLLDGEIINEGCFVGAKEYTNIINGKSWFNKNNLVAIGKVRKSGDVVYELSDKLNNPHYQSIFKVTAEGMGIAEADLVSNPNYIKFINDQPLFIWQDPFGNYRSYYKIKYQTAAECGKPVIYLYPKKTTDVSVKVYPSGGFSHTEPEYGTGWSVSASPDSQLINKIDGKIYPYLFWEGQATGFGFPKEGFVLSRANLETELSMILKNVGLNNQETADFVEFWAPKMKVKPYVFVTFADQAEFSRAVPLQISPRPNSVLRVMMSFSPLDKNKIVPPLVFKPFVRHGFTVVEWGGVLYGV